LTPFSFLHEGVDGSAERKEEKKEKGRPAGNPLSKFEINIPTCQSCA
jgi:hypothetical protein